MAVIQNTSCPNCGGRMKFDPTTQSTICVKCSSPLEDPAQTKDELQCPNCGAPLKVIEGASQAVCNACDSTFSLAKDDDCQITNLPEESKFIAPFTVPQDEYRKSMITWLVNRKGLPTDIFDGIAFINSEGCYVPYYYCTVDYKIQWSASIGHNRTERYTEYVQRKHNGRVTTVPVTKTRTVTDWSPFSSSSAGRFSMSCPASSYVRNIEQSIIGAATGKRKRNVYEQACGTEDFTIDDSFQNCTVRNTSVRIDKLDSKYTAGFKVLPFEGVASNVYDKNKANNMIYARIKSEAPGDVIKNINFHGDFTKNFYALHCTGLSGLQGIHMKKPRI
jgi:DNA-directed RNA polymerase subunit RPC12/RpoP